MLERWTAFLAQAAATVLVLIGLVVLLGFTHMRSYRAGFCANNACEIAEALPQQTSDPVIYPVQNDSGLIPATAALPNAQSVNPAASSAQPVPDPPPNLSARPASANDDEDLPVSDSVSGTRAITGSSRRPGSSAGRRGTYDEYYPTPGDDICNDYEGPVTDADLARCWLRIGDAYQSIGQLDFARRAWDRSLEIGAYRGAQASLVAQQRMQAATLAQACRTTYESLERISRGHRLGEVEGGGIIDLQLRQQSLAALGYYADEVDGSYGPNTRRAVRDFQADMGFDQTGALNPRETVDLICHAAITARDPGAQNLLGIMFATGLGVELNVDMAIEWLEIAATRGHPEANFNLALIYGTGTIQGSYRMCGVVESPERADSYLRRAAELEHGRARIIRDNEGFRQDAVTRWDNIAARLGSEAAQARDPFWEAWQARLDEAEADAAYRAIQPGCYLTAVAERAAAAEEDPAP